MERTRITSLDALRAFILFGIFIIHATYGFGLEYNLTSDSDHIVLKFVNLLLTKRCNIIFNILFGISFYIILRKPDYSNTKMIWRCCILMMIGLMDIFFYGHDVLIWYGFAGILLVPFRSLSNKKLLFILIVLLVLSLIPPGFKLGDYLWGSMSTIPRYGINEHFFNIISTDSIRVNLHGELNQGVFKIFSFILFGYYLGRIGLIENLKDKITLRIVSMAIVSYILFYILNHYIAFFFLIRNFAGALFIAIFFLYLYSNINKIKKFLSLFEPYGKMGLTNYSMQGVIGVCAMSEFGLGLYKQPLTIILTFTIIFFLAQSLFSYFWLSKFRYGPLEFIWRKLTEIKIPPLLIFANQKK